MSEKYEMMIPTLLSGDRLIEELRYLPEYDPMIREADTATRLESLADMYRIYYPFPMSVEIYNKLYLATVLSLKKNTKEAVRQHNMTYRAMTGDRQYKGIINGGDRQYKGIIGGGDSFSIIGRSGLGKTSAIQQALQLISGGKIIEGDDPYCKIIPCLQVQCPFDASPKGLLLEILRNVDKAIDTRYYECSRKASDTTDILIGTVSQVALNHVGLLVIDEIQNVWGRKNGTALMSMIIQLINSSGISIAMVGTEECISFFESAAQLARRAQGLRYDALPYDKFYEDFCKTVWEYQYTSSYKAIDHGIMDWIYEHSGGIVSNIISLIHDAQEIAIMEGQEVLDLSTLSNAYSKRMSFMQRFINTPATNKYASAAQKKEKFEETVVEEYLEMEDLIKTAKEKGADTIELLREHITIEEVDCG